MQNGQAQTQPLSELASGETAFFIQVSAGKEAAGRLTSLGFTPGAQILMTQNFGRGPLLVTIRGTRVALGREEARKILIQKE
jgi:ferrous iron transport protein A